VFHYHTRSPNFQVPIIRVYNHIHVLICAKALTYHTTKHLFQYRNHGRTIDIFKFLELLERVYQIDIAAHFYLNEINTFVSVILSNGISASSTMAFFPFSFFTSSITMLLSFTAISFPSLFSPST